MADKSYYVEEILKLIKEAEADGYFVDADWEEIRIGEPGEKYGGAAVLAFDYTGTGRGWEMGK